MRVWDAFVRVCHWALVICVAGAWFTQSGAPDWHTWLGYAVLAVLVLRLVWGFIGPASARFARFIRSPGKTFTYAGQVLAGRAPRHLGHNPLGGWMIVLLLLAVAATGITGWLFTTDAFWGDERLEEVHYVCAVTLLVLVALHVVGVIVMSVKHRENLAGAMIHGNKRAAGQGDIGP